MKVFISWSGERSRYIANALKQWLPKVIQQVKPWMSDQDIRTGSRWLYEINEELDTTIFGIVILTPENIDSSWIQFEAGSLSKSVTESFVCPVLYELKPSEIDGPLSQFQSVVINKMGIQDLVNSINKSIINNLITENELIDIVNVWYPTLEKLLKTIPKIKDINKRKKRTTNEILEEILNNSREQLRRENIRIEDYKKGLETSKLVSNKLSEFIKPILNQGKISMNDLEIISEEDPELTELGKMANLMLDIQELSLNTTEKRLIEAEKMNSKLLNSENPNNPKGKNKK